MIPPIFSSSPNQLIKRFFIFYLLIFLKSIHFCLLPLPLLSQSCQLLLSEPLGGLFIDHWNMVPAMHLYYLCPLRFDWLWKCTIANFFLPPYLHALKSSHCLPLQPMHLNPCTLFIWSQSLNYYFNRLFCYHTSPLLSLFPSLTCSSHTLHQLLEHCMSLPSLGLCINYSPLCSSLLLFYHLSSI